MGTKLVIGCVAVLLVALSARPQGEPKAARYEFATLYGGEDGSSLNSILREYKTFAEICYFEAQGCRMERSQNTRKDGGSYPLHNATIAAATKLGNEGWEMFDATRDRDQTVLYFRRRVN